MYVWRTFFSDLLYVSIVSPSKLSQLDEDEEVVRMHDGHTIEPALDQYDYMDKFEALKHLLIMFALIYGFYKLVELAIEPKTLHPPRTFIEASDKKSNTEE
jgi:hypothetical protein